MVISCRLMDYGQNWVISGPLAVACGCADLAHDRHGVPLAANIQIFRDCPKKGEAGNVEGTCSHVRVKGSQSCIRNCRPYTVTVVPIRKSCGPKHSLMAGA